LGTARQSTLEGGLLAEELAAVAGDFAQPGTSATMDNVTPEYATNPVEANHGV
jgi:hypothetical protein